MGKVKKQKRHLKFRYDQDRKKNWKKAKGVPTIKCDEIKNAWDETKSVKRNLLDMGISADANKTLKVLSKKQRVGHIEMEVDIEKTPVKDFVVKDLEEKASIPGRKKMSMSDEDAGLCVYLMDKYGDDFKAMAMDERNYYQETPKQIQRKINRFKSIPEMYSLYAQAKQAKESSCRLPLAALSPTKYLSRSAEPFTALLPLGCKSRLRGEAAVLSPRACLPRHTEPLVTLSPTRYMTRRTEACLRNGHFMSPPGTHPLEVFVPDAAICRVRRRLQFGRKPPRNRELMDT